VPTTADGPDTRSASQRLGDGFREMLRRYLDTGASPTQGGEKPHLVITIDHDDLVNGTGTGTLLHTGTAVSAKTAQEFACDAKTSTYTPGNKQSGNGAGGNPSGNGGGTSTTGPNSADADAGRGGNGEATLTDPVRFFVGKTRRLLELRDRGCAFPGCDRPPAWTHAHHIVAWYRGGTTTLDNGVLLCGHHHRLIHKRAWTVAIADDGLPDFTPPDWIDPNAA
jgi:uncharacterized protein DUF222/HNH endonuclease